MSQKKIFLIIVIVIVIIAIGYAVFLKNQTPISPARQEVFFSQEECQQKTGKSCSLQMCDYIPPGKTPEEVCGKNFKKGWVPQISAATKNTAQ